MPCPSGKSGRLVIVALALLGCKEPDPSNTILCKSASSEHERAEAAFDRYRRPDLIIAALGLRGGERVADIGAGRGYLSFRLAEAVGANGSVVATDVDAEALVALRSRAVCKGGAASHIGVRKVPVDEPSLPKDHYELILMSEVDHLLTDRTAYLRRLRPYLAGGGRLVVCNRRSSREALLRAALDAGFVQLREDPSLPAHFLLFFGVHP